MRARHRMLFSPPTSLGEVATERKRAAQHESVERSMSGETKGAIAKGRVSSKRMGMRWSLLGTKYDW